MDNKILNEYLEQYLRDLNDLPKTIDIIDYPGLNPGTEQMRINLNLLAEKYNNAFKNINADIKEFIIYKCSEKSNNDIIKITQIWYDRLIELGQEHDMNFMNWLKLNM